MLVGEARVRWSACCLLLGRPLARVLDRQRGGDHDHLVGAAEPVGLEHHPRPAAGRPAAARAGAPSVGQPRAAVVERAELLAAASIAVAHLAAVGRVEEREVLDRRRGRSAAICRITDARFVRRISGSVKRGRASKSSSA